MVEGLVAASVQVSLSLYPTGRYDVATTSFLRRAYLPLLFFLAGDHAVAGLIVAGWSGELRAWGK